MIREIKEGSEIIFCRKSSSAYTCKMLNNKIYFVSEVNKKFLTKDYTPILNGETFKVMSIIIENLHVEKIILYRYRLNL